MSEILKKDPVFRPLVEQITLPPLKDETVYFSLTRSIISQQLSVKAASTIFTRFLGLFESGQPHPEQLLTLKNDKLRSAGVSQQKAGYLKNIAEQAAKDDWSSMDWDGMPDLEVMEYLTRIKGVGKWTVEMILIFTLKRPDVFSSGDLGIQQAMKKLYALELDGKELIRTMESISAPWSPDRSLACRYLWHWKDGVK